MPNVETSTPANTPTPIGPYSHIAKVGPHITIGGVFGAPYRSSMIARTLGSAWLRETEQTVTEPPNE